jgi:hypothetical protein
MAKKISPSYSRKKQTIKQEVTRRSVEKIKIAAFGPGYRTSGTLKPGKTRIGSPTGTKIKTDPKTGSQRTVSQRTGKNPNTTKKEAKLVGAVGRTTIRKSYVKEPFKSTSNRIRPYAGKARPVLVSQLKKRRKK